MKTEPRQEYRDLEKLGFLCRWALLAMAAVVILTATWTGLAGTIAISSDLGTTMLLSEAVWGQGAKSPSVRGFLDNPTPKSGAPLFVYRDHLGRPRFPWFQAEHNEIYPSLPAPPAGTHRITLRGLPYGPMAFTQYQATLRIVPSPMTVYLLDAQFLAGVERDDKQTAIRIAKEFSRLGQPVLVFPPQRELLENLMAQLNQYSDIPRVFSLRKGRGDLPVIIASITQKLKSDIKRVQRKPYVVTGNVKVAIATANKGHYTHLVRSENTPSNLPDLIRLHATPEKLAEHLANERPAHLPIP